MEETRMPIQEEVVTASPAVPKKKSSVGKIIALVLGGLVLCCFVAGFLIYSFWNGIQNGPQATSVKTVWQALDQGNEATVKKYAGDELYSDLYTEDETGVTNADYIKGSNIKIVIAQANVDLAKNTAEVYYVLTADKNTEVLGSFNYAKLEKEGEIWIVTYLGTNEQPTDSPASTLD